METTSIAINSVEDYKNAIKTLKRKTFWTVDDISLEALNGDYKIGYVRNDKAYIEGVLRMISETKEMERAYLKMCRLLDEQSIRNYEEWAKTRPNRLVMRVDFELTKKGEAALAELKSVQHRANARTILERPSTIVRVCLKGKVSERVDLPKSYRYEASWTEGIFDGKTIKWERKSGYCNN